MAATSHQFPRTPELLATVRDMRTSGATWTTIGLEIGCAPCTAHAIGCEIGLGQRAPRVYGNSGKPRNSEEVRNLIRKMWDEGAPVTAIAAATGKTLYAVTGMVGRMRLVRRPSPIKPAVVDTRKSGTQAPLRPVLNEGGHAPIPAGHPMTWGLITEGTILQGAPYR